MTIRVLLVDDHPLVLAGLTRLLSSEPDVSIVATAANGQEALRAMRQWRPDIVVLDLRMPGVGGLAVLRQMKLDSIAVRAIVFTAMEEDEVFESLRLGASGIVLKSMAPEKLIECIRDVHAGGIWLEKTIAAKALQHLLKHEEKDRLLAAVLTPREIQVARMVVEGLSSKAVAGRLAISEGTAKLHLHHIYRKLKVHGRAALAMYVAAHDRA